MGKTECCRLNINSPNSKSAIWCGLSAIYKKKISERIGAERIVQSKGHREPVSSFYSADITA
jgi:hypothetical protein